MVRLTAPGSWPMSCLDFRSPGSPSDGKNGSDRRIGWLRHRLDHGATHVIQMDAISRTAAAVRTVAIAAGADWCSAALRARRQTPGWSRKRRLLSRGGSLYAADARLPIRT